jgi:copper chaperone CopZ
MERIKVKGMSCQHCVGAVKQALEGLGLKEVVVDLEAGEASYREPASISRDRIQEAISAIGFEPVD